MSLQTLLLIQNEVRQLLDRGAVDRHQPIYILARYFVGREWVFVERELEANNFLLRDRIGDLVASEDWHND
ncbi:MAG: DUF4327 family protein [Leptolyngbyaceae cyanobacterium bins.349]|nr:DUF4327 family protein [Leptolyngbyaceae cyanobacterium bins.349]